MSIQSVREQLNIEGGKFEGDLFIKLIPEGGGAARRIGPINGTQLAYNPGEADVVTRTSRMRTTYGQNLNTDSQPGSPTVEIGFNDLGKEQLELQMRGTSSASPPGRQSASTTTCTPWLGRSRGRAAGSARRRSASPHTPVALITARAAMR